MEPVAASAARIGGISLLRLQSDEALARLAATGSDDAFEALVRRYRKTLLRSCRRLLSEDRAEDAVQQALLDAHQALARNGTPERLRPWLHRIAVNAALKIARESGEVAPIPVDEGKANGGESPEQTHERRERLRRTIRAIDALPRRQRRALVLRELEGRSHDEIARELGLSGGAVRQLIHRARNSVRSAASALIPPAFVLRLLGAGGSAPAEEIAAGGAGGAVAAKVAVAALVTGGVAGGVALENRGGDRSSSAGAAQTRESPSDTGAPAAPGLSGDVTAAALAGSGSSGRSGSNSGPGGGEGGSSGPGSGSSDDNSGSGSSDDDGSGSSGSGSGDDLVSSGSDSSGSGSSGSDSSGSGSGGSVSSGSGSSGSGPSDSELTVESSGSGSSGSIDSGSSGSGSYTSDSSGSGSGSSGSDSGSSGEG